MDRIVTLKSKTTTENEFGEEIVIWADIAEVWSERLELRGDERYQSMQTVGSIQCLYRIRYRDDVSTLDMLIDSNDNKEYDIHYVKQLGRRDGLELTVGTRSE
ncbi:MAG: phage head closure protein [Spirochaetales bacterium]|nr:phage head closure protein [Spirochaetales bacterium]